MTLFARGTRSPSSTLAESLRQHRWFLLVLLVFSAAVVPTLRDGIGSFDAHNTLGIAQTLVDDHVLLPTRSPGHPGNVYLFGSLAWVSRHAFNRPLSDVVFSALQWLTALLVAGAFYRWLLRSGVTRGLAAVGVACLVGSPQFLLQAIDGEELLLALFFFFSGLCVLARSPRTPISFRRLALAIVCFAVATTFRAEYVIAAALSGAVYLSLARASWKTWLAAMAVAVASLAILWFWTLRSQGIENPDPQMAFGQAFLAWGYKLLFLCFGFPTSLVLFGAFALVAKRLFSTRPSTWSLADAPQLTALMAVAAYFALYVTHPHKPANVLITLPFLLLLVLRQSRGFVVAAAACTLASIVAGVDLFRDRVFTGPRLVPGGYRFALDSKPQQQQPYLRGLTAIPVSRPTILIGDVYSWVLAYHVEHGQLAAHLRHAERSREGQVWALDADPNRMLTGRECLKRSDVLQRFRELGYDIAVDRVLWRTLFARYDISTRSEDAAFIGRVPVRLVTVTPLAER